MRGLSAHPGLKGLVIEPHSRPLLSASFDALTAACVEHVTWEAKDAAWPRWFIRDAHWWIDGLASPIVQDAAHASVPDLSNNDVGADLLSCLDRVVDGRDVKGGGVEERSHV